MIQHVHKSSIHLEAEYKLGYQSLLPLKIDANYSQSLLLLMEHSSRSKWKTKNITDWNHTADPTSTAFGTKPIKSLSFHLVNSVFDVKVIILH